MEISLKQYEWLKQHIKEREGMIKELRAQNTELRAEIMKLKGVLELTGNATVLTHTKELYHPLKVFSSRRQSRYQNLSFQLN